ncbi:MAG: tetratricopeptide repeat protein [Candidatus Ozemobacteraceae bacterium]
MQKIFVPLLVLSLLVVIFLFMFPASRQVLTRPLPPTVGGGKPGIHPLPPDATSIQKKASDAIDRGNYDEALQLLEPLKNVADNPEIKNLFGYAHAGKKEFFDAIACFEASLAKKNDPRTLYALAVTYDAAGEGSKAKARFIELSRGQIPQPILVKTFLGIARNAMFMNDIPTAIDAFKRVIKEDPSQVDAFVGLIKLMKRTGAGKGIDKIREKGDPLHSKNFDYQFWLGCLYYEMGQDSQSLAAFKAAAALRPDNASPHYYQYRILRKSKKIEEAVSSLENFYRLNPFLPYIFFQAAIDAKTENRLDIAFKFMRAAVLVDRSLLGGDDQGTLNAVDRYVNSKGSVEEKSFNKAFSMFLNGDYRGAFSKAREIAIAFKDPSLKNDNGRLLDECGKIISGEDAYSAYQKNMAAAQTGAMSRLKAQMASRKPLGTTNPSGALDELKSKALSNPKDAKLQYGTALQLARAGDIEGAKIFLRETIRANPNVSEAYYSLAKLSRSDGNSTEAASHLEQAIKVNPGNSQARSLLASIHLESGDIDRAITEAKGAIMANPNNGEARLVLANAHLQAQRPEQALREVEYGLTVETDPARIEQLEALKRQLAAH